MNFIQARDNATISPLLNEATPQKGTYRPLPKKLRILYTTASNRLSVRRECAKMAGLSFSVRMQLHDLLYISYLVPVSRVRQLVPRMLPLNVIGKNKVFVSLVVLRCTDVHLSCFPLIRFAYNQINLRTYVRDPDTGANGVYFIASGVSSPWISNIAGLYNLSWQPINLRYSVIHKAESPVHPLRSKGMWCGDFSIHAQPAKEDVEHIYPFEKVAGAMEYMVKPLLGFYGQHDDVRKFRISHTEIRPYRATVEEVSFPLLNMLEIVDEEATSSPDAVFSVQRAEFQVFLPPRKVTPIW